MRSHIGTERQKSGRYNTLADFPRVVEIIFSVLLSSFHIYTGLFGSFEALKQRTLHLFLALPLIFLVIPIIKQKKRTSIGVYNIALIACSLASIGWLIYDYDRISMRMSLISPVSTVDMVLGIILLFLVLEAARRAVGFPMALLGLLSLLYAYYGRYVPGKLMFEGLPFYRIIDIMYLTTNGIWGIPIGVIASFVFLYILLGAFLESSGAGNFYIDLAYSITGGRLGGPAKAAVISSGFMGSISGSAIANVVTTGTFSIPLMKRSGYPPHYAAAVEAASSAGGQLMPPIMGAGAFLIAEFVGVSYFHVVKVSLIPATLYFFSIYVYVHLQAKKLGITALPKDKLKSTRQVIREGWFHFLPLAVLIYYLVSGYTAMRAGISGLIVCFLIWLTATIKEKLPQKSIRAAFEIAYELCDIMSKGARNALPVIAACACAGIIVGVVTMSGISAVFSSLVLSASFGKLYLAILLIALASLILGMGMNTTSAYILLAVLAAPALKKFGVPILTGHMIVFWLSQDTHITPPVCIATYTAAGIADSSPLKTALTAFKIAKGMYIIPFLYAYTPLLLNGTVLEVCETIFFAIFGLMAFAIALEGFGFKRLKHFERMIIGTSAIMMLWPSQTTHLVGILIYAISMVLPKIFKGGPMIAKKE